MSEWKQWSSRMTRLDIAPGAFLTLRHDDGDRDWSSSLDIRRDGLTYSAAHTFDPSDYLTDDTVAAGENAIMDALGPKMEDYWTSRLIRLDQAAGDLLGTIVSKKMSEINARFPSAANGRLPEFHFYASYGMTPADKPVTHGYRDAERIMDGCREDLWTTQMALLERAGDILDGNRARVFVHDLDADGRPYVYEIVLGGATPDGKELRRAHNFYRLWRASAFTP